MQYYLNVRNPFRQKMSMSTITTFMYLKIVYEVRTDLLAFCAFVDCTLCYAISQNKKK